MTYNYKYTLNYNSNNVLEGCNFDALKTSRTKSVTLTRDASLNTRVIVFANDFSDALKQADLAMGTHTSTNALNYLHNQGVDPRDSFIQRQIKSRNQCRELLIRTAHLNDQEEVKVSIGLLRFLVAILDSARDHQLNNEPDI